MENRDDDSAASKMETSQDQLPSALTVENLRKHEEETDSIDVVELMTKNKGKDDIKDVETADETKRDDEDANESARQDMSLNEEDRKLGQQPESPTNERLYSNGKEEVFETKSEGMQLLGDIWSQPKKQVVEPIPSPAVREEVRGFKFSGEEYVAVSIDVQTDESYLVEVSPWPKKKLISEIADLQSEKQDPTIPADLAEISAPSERREGADRKDSEVTEDDFVKNITELGLKDIAAASNLSVSEVNQTLPAVGHPFILQYKPESQMVQPKFSDISVSDPDDSMFYGAGFEEDDYYKTVRDGLKQITEEKTAMLTEGENLINIEPHTAFSNQRGKKLSKDFEGEKSVTKEMKKQPKQAAATGGKAAVSQTNFYAFARQLKTVNYSLSSEKCMEEGWTIRPLTPPGTEAASPELFVHDEFGIVSGKGSRKTFVKKLYPNGATFLIIFPDGTGNVWYPSGNLAFSIIASGKLGKLTFIVHQDVDPSEGENIQAVFEPSGYCVCYYPSGLARLVLSPSGGEYYGPQGQRLKRWLWKDTTTHVHAPPFQPITFGLSKNVGVRIIAQESIFITFSERNRSVRFNAGTRLRVNESTSVPKVFQADVDEFFLNEARFNVLSILEKIQNRLKLPKSPRLERIPLPNYLVAKIDKNAKLRERLQNQMKKEVESTKKSTKFRNRISGNENLTEKLPVIKKKNQLVTMTRNACQEEANLHPIVIIN